GGAIAPELEFEVTGRVEDLNAMIGSVSDVDILTAVYCDAGRKKELTISRASAPELKLEVACRVEDLNAIVVAIINVYVLAILGYAVRRRKMTVDCVVVFVGVFVDVVRIEG